MADRPSRHRREPKRLTEDEVAALRKLIPGQRKRRAEASDIGAYAALLAAIAALVSSLVSSGIALWDRIAGP